jgi:carboxyl-terminal processing protease
MESTPPQPNGLRQTLILLIVFVVGVGAGVALDRSAPVVYAQPNAIVQQGGPDTRRLTEAWGIIQRVYVDRSALQSTTLTYGAISGMVDALGDTGHSAFLTPAMLKDEQQQTQGQFTGVGLQVEAKNHHVVVVAPLDDSPAQKAGLRAGEVILKVNGQDISALPLDQVVALIQGPAGSQVTLTLSDPQTGQTRDVTLTRERITVQNVTWAMLPGTNLADLRLSAFSQSVTPDLKTALAAIRQQGATGLVLDLRNNPGGLLDEAVGAASQFLASGDVLLEKDAQGKITPVPVQSGGLATSLPMVVLINSGTASAAEIVSGALQDAHRATLVGDTTFGTGTVLSTFPLSDGSALLLAIQEWLTPAGRVIWHQGIAPDQAVPLPAGATALSPSALRGLSAAQLQSSDDAQLLRAVQLLTR